MDASENDPSSQGRLLRTALIDHVRSAREAGEVQRSGMHSFIAVGDLIGRYLREGVTFDYAEQVLRNAEFTVGTRPSPGSSNMFVGSEDEFDVHAFLAQRNWMA